MAHVQKTGKTDQHATEDHLKGTFASVLILGGILAASWLTVFIIFMVRNGG